MIVQIIKNRLSLGLIVLFIFISAASPPGGNKSHAVLTGADQFDAYKALLENCRVGVIVNQTSRVGQVHLVDYLKENGIEVVKIFAPEHGFRGTAEAGEYVKGGMDSRTGLPIVSLYGRNKKPTEEQLSDVDVLIFDIQDVGARFFTYISTMHYAMEAAAAYGKAFLVLDRPNPNGFYVDGPLLDTAYRSFVGMHPIPIVHGLTIGELALMINGEKWLEKGRQASLTVIPVKGWSHKDSYSLPVKASPNLPNDLSVRMYPSLCLFEGTVISMGRGTLFPFQVIGFPDPSFGDFQFVPMNILGMATNPPYKGDTCYGIDFREVKNPPAFTLQYVIDFYAKAPDKSQYFVKFFNTLAGTDALRKQIEAGFTEEEIRESWIEDLADYKNMRKKYLLYPDYE